MKRYLTGRGLTGLALAAGLAAAGVSEGAFAMMTSHDVDRMKRSIELTDSGAVNRDLGKPGEVILEREARSEPLGYEKVGERVGRIPIDKVK